MFLLQGYATITILPNNFENGWVGFDGSSTHVVTSIISSRPVVLSIRRESSASLGQLTVSIEWLLGIIPIYLIEDKTSLNYGVMQFEATRMHLLRGVCCSTGLLAPC